MKQRSILFLSLLIVCSALAAKTTYIPNYFTSISIINNGVTKSDSAYTRQFSYDADDERYTITVLHDSVTNDRIKAIKRMKAAAGWATAAAILGGVSAGLNPLNNGRDAVNYVNSMNIAVSSGFLRVCANSNASDLQHVPISIVITNNSDREMVINDTSRGLVWYIPAHEYLKLDVGNPEINRFRIAYNDCHDQQINYAVVQAGNYLSKETIEYEDDECWVYQAYDIKYKKNQYGDVYSEKTFIGYCCLDKVTFEWYLMNKDELKAFLRKKKDN